MKTMRKALIDGWAIGILGGFGAGMLGAGWTPLNWHLLGMGIVLVLLSAALLAYAMKRYPRPGRE